jgi:hypothetical protein
MRIKINAIGHLVNKLTDKKLKKESQSLLSD